MHDCDYRCFLHVCLPVYSSLPCRGARAKAGEAYRLNMQAKKARSGVGLSLESLDEGHDVKIASGHVLRHIKYSLILF